MQCSLELRQDFSSVFQGVLFYDIGKVYDEGVQTDFLKGSGFGFRYFTPIGPIRLDLSWMDGTQFKFEDMIVHIQLGQLF